MLDIYLYKLKEFIHNSFSIKMSSKYKDIELNNISNYAWYKLKEVLLNRYNITIDIDDIIYNEYHKPYIKDNPIYFNISHSNNYILLGISDTECGVDIEKEIINDRLYTKFPNYDKNTNITELWVYNESYLKMKGLSLRFNEIYKELNNIYKITLEEDIYYLCGLNKENDSIFLIDEDHLIE